ncbi:family 20 glycosylhydrolase [Chryseolinea lacunae]|uniref:beta-N-acetylhexosaminidase n=1 Tax=Chryseolinea lacunae TaxID=2801331 RepID=A0ABS1KJX3_9BACT|nr:family 20 glycosylhydrolase [Chryseolinea lacunae]MBL0739655.1 carbohydate-binding domain-containing protein [Chryseolinea lacunae]
MNVLKRIFCFVLLVCCAACQPGKDPLDTASKIAVQWEVVTNFTDQKEVFDARFEIINNSEQALDEKNWALFFSMAPRKILENKTPQPAILHHINGDWYVLKPEKGFSLAPGKAVAITYRGIEAVIKETDRPLGLYFVFYDDEGHEKKIVNVTDYTCKPFLRAEQINRNEKDEEPIPSAALSFKNNLEMTDVPASALQPILPTPVHYEAGTDSVDIDNKWIIHYGKGLEQEAAYLAKHLNAATGKEFITSIDAPKGKCIVLEQKPLTVKGVSKEAYHLGITSSGVVITGSDAAGVFYGVQSLRACIPLKNYETKSAGVRLRHMQVEDAPRFSFRGLHLDVSRNFQTKETILRTLDLLSFYKINRFLFYTTEDEGWRLEIKDLPELTDVGAQRQHTSGKEAPALHPAYGSGPFSKEEGRYGHGYYSREDFIEILKYAAERHIKVIPELNFPGHARAAIKAMEARYERLMKEGKETEANEYRLIDPDDRSEYESAQGYSDNVVSVARESVFHFYEKVVDEIAATYKDAGLTLDEFHTGGDEVAEGAWTRSPLAAELLKQHPEIRDPKNLQTYFLRELVKRLKSRNLQLDGWEEVALVKTESGKYEPNPEFAKANIVPYIWNNIFDYPDLGYRLANAGYNVVLCNVSNFYFDLAYSKDPQEPGLYWAGFVDTRHSWTFAPFDMFKTTKKNSLGQKLELEGVGDYPKNKIIVEHLKPEARKNILGLEAQVWCETVKGRDMLEYYMLPKLIGFAESAWTAERTWETVENRTQREALMLKGWNVFANALAKRELPRLHYLNGGYQYRIPPPGAVLENGELKANTEYPGLIIRYTTDGSEPSSASTRYDGPVQATGTVTLRSFDRAGQASRSVKATAE